MGNRLKRSSEALRRNQARRAAWAARHPASSIVLSFVVGGGLLTLVVWSEGIGIAAAATFGGFGIVAVLILLYRDTRRGGRRSRGDDLF